MLHASAGAVRLRRVFAAIFALLAGALVLLAFAPKASAAIPGDSGAAPYGICSSTDKYTSEQASADDQLPINRWQNVASGPIHTRLGAAFYDDITEKIQRNVMDVGALSLGNTMWQTSVQATEYASRFCLADSVGYRLDKFAAQIGHAVINSGLLAGAIVLGVAMCLWRAYKRSSNPWGGIIKIFLTVGVMVAMVTGASATTSTSFGTFSPGWIATTINNTVSSLAAAPASALAASSSTLTGMTKSDGNQAGCGAYVNQLLTNYTESYGGKSISNAAAVPKVMDAMWENSGLAAYLNVQFGTQNNYGPDVYCHLLEYDAGVTPQQQLAVYKGVSSGLASGADLDSLALAGTDTNKDTDRSIIAFAACRYSGGKWHVVPEWAQVTHPVSDGSNTATVTSKTCEDWWSKPMTGFNSGTSALEWIDSPSTINDATANQPQVRDFLLNFHGDANSSATTVAFAFAGSSIIVVAVFGLMAAAVILAKIMLIVLTLMSIFALIADILLSAGQSTSSRTASLAKTYIGTTFFAFGSSLVLSMIAIMAGFMATVSTSVSGKGSLISVLWTGFAPVLAIFAVHWVFKHILKAPSPFKLTSGGAWAAAAGGAAVGAGVQALHDRAVSRGKRYAGAGVSRFFGRTPSRSGADPRVGGMPSTNPRGTTTPGTTAPAGTAAPDTTTDAPTTSSAPPNGKTSVDGTGRPVRIDKNGKERPISQRAAERHGARQMASEAGYTGRLAVARHAMARSWNGATRAQKATKALKVAGAVAGAALVPVALPASLVGAGALWAINRERKNRRNPQIRQDRQNQHSQEHLDAYNRCLNDQRRQAGTAPEPGTVDPGKPNAGSPAPSGDRETTPSPGNDPQPEQKTVDGPDIEPKAGPHGHQFGPGGEQDPHRGPHSRTPAGENPNRWSQNPGGLWTPNALVPPSIKGTPEPAGR